MVAKATKVLFRIAGTHRTAVVKTSAIDDNYVVWFYYDGYQDDEWKRGSHGIACDNCKTLAQAKSKAKRYIAKDYE